MNAPVTSAANLAGGCIAPEARPAPEASGFHALFATASRNVPGNDIGPELPPAAVKDAESGGADRDGKKTTAENKADDDTDGGVLGALAAALVSPVAIGITFQGLAAGGEKTGTPRCSESVEPAPTAVEATPSNSATAAPTKCAAATATVAGAKFVSELQGVPVPADALGLAEETADDQAAAPGPRATPAGGEVTTSANADVSGAADSKITAREDADAWGADTVHQSHESPSGPALPGAATSFAAEVPGLPAGSSTAFHAAPQVTTVKSESGAVTAGSSPSSSSEAEQSAVAKKIAAPDEVPIGAVDQRSTTAEEARRPFAVDPAAAKSNRGGAKSSVEPNADVAQGDDFSVLVQNRPSPEAIVSAPNQAISAPAPHSASPSPPAPAHTAMPELVRADASAVRAAPALQTTHILQRMDKAEIRIGLQSADFGAIRLHTTVANDQVGAVVSTSHAGLRDALLVEAPSLERAIARHSLRLDSVNVGVGTGASSANSNSLGSNERQQNPAAPANARLSTWTAGRGVRSQAAAAPAPTEERYRLDVRA